MRPLDKPFDLVTLVVATGREEVQRTAGLTNRLIGGACVQESLLTPLNQHFSA